MTLVPEVQQDNKTHQAFILWACLTGLAVRLGFVLTSGDTAGMVDAWDYWGAAADLRRVGSIQSDLVMPLYPILALIAGTPQRLQVADALFSAATVGLIGWLSLLVFQNGKAARLAAAIAALYPFFVYYAAGQVTETFFMFLLCAAFVALYKEAFGAGGILLILAILTRPNIAPLAPFLIILFSSKVHGATRGRTARRTARFGLLFLLLLTPWWIHNYEKYDRFVPFTLGSGRPLFYGNVCPQMDEGVQSSLKNQRECPDAYSGVQDPVARNDSLVAATGRFIRDNPGVFSRLVVLKFVAFWRPWVYTESWPSRVAAILSYGTVFVFAIIFLVANRRTAVRRLSPMLALGAYLCVVHVISYSYIRYRLPIEPFLIVIGSYALVVALAGRLRSHSG